MNDVIENPENLEAPQEAPAAPIEQSNDFDFVLDKYRADGRTDQDAAFEQAKAYPELFKRFGGFTGAPEQYDLSVNDSAVEMGVQMDMETPLIAEMAAVAKELNMSNDGFNQFAEVMVRNAIAEQKAHEDALKEEINSLTNSSDRIANINGFVSSNLSPEAVKAFQMMPQSAAQIEAIEELIGLARGGSIAPQEANTMEISENELNEMRTAVDGHGNRRLQTDPEFRREYEQKMKLKYGTQPYRERIG